jgi:hypothetical protein
VLAAQLARIAGSLSARRITISACCGGNWPSNNADN